MLMLISSNDFLSYSVFNEDDQKIGRVNDCIINTDTLIIEQIIVRTTSVLNPLAPGLIINRKQIIRIEPGKIIVNNPDIKVSSLQNIQLPTLKSLQPKKAESPISSHRSSID